MNAEKKYISTKKNILVAPDGGWGYIICIAVTVHFVTTTAFMGCFGMLFKDFFEEIGMTSAQVTLLAGTSSMCLALSGFITGPLLKVLSMRKLAFMSAIIFDLGVLGTVFVKTEFPLYICYGVMQGAGLGLSYNISCTILNAYFVKQRLLANGIVQAITALCTMFAPTFCSWSLNEYGFRGTLLLITGLVMHNIIASALMQPVKWHMKKIEVLQEDEEKLSLVDNTKSTSLEIPTVKVTDIEKNANGSVEKIYEFPPDPKKSKGLRKFLEKFIDLSLCKTFLLSCPCLGTSLSVFADTAFSIMLPQALYAAEWDQESVAWALSSFLFGDLVIRTVLIFASKLLIMLGSETIFIFGVVIALFTRLGMLWSSSRIAIVIYIALMGTSRGIFSVLLSVVIADAVTPEQFTSAMGITLFLFGTMNLVLAPGVGVIRDLSNSYSTAFYVITCIFAIVLLFWSIEILYKRNEHKRRAREESLKAANKSVNSSKCNKVT